MNIAELFVNLGIKGTDKTVSAIVGVHGKLSDTKTMALETKAAILGAVLAFEKMIGVSAKLGSTLSNFKTLTGISSQVLEQHQYAARQIGATNEEVTGSFMSLQEAMLAIKRGEGAPAGFQIIAQTIGGIRSNLEDMPGLLQEFQKFAQDPSVNEATKRWALGTTGMTDNMIVALERGKFSLENFKKAPTFSDKKNHSLQGAEAAMLNLEDRFKRGMSNFTANHGEKIVDDLGLITGAVFKMINALTILAEKTKVFTALGWSLDKIATGVNLASVVVDDSTGAHKKSDNENLFGKGMISGVLNWRDDIDTAVINRIKELMTSTPANAYIATGAQAAIPYQQRAPVVYNSQVTHQHVAVTHHGDAKDTHAVGQLHKASARQLNNATRQRPQGQGN